MANRILLIEDDRSTADYIANGLREEGFLIDHAANGREEGAECGQGARAPHHPRREHEDCWGPGLEEEAQKACWHGSKPAVVWPSPALRKRIALALLRPAPGEQVQCVTSEAHQDH